MAKTKNQTGIPAQEPETIKTANHTAVINEADGEPIFHADEEAGDNDA